MPAPPLLPCSFQWPLFCSVVTWGTIESRAICLSLGWGGVAGLGVPRCSGGVCRRVGGPSLGLAEGRGENEAGQGRW